MLINTKNDLCQKKNFIDSIRGELKKYKVTYFDPNKVCNLEMDNISYIVSVEKTVLSKIFAADQFKKYINITNNLVEGIYIENDDSLSAIIFYLKENIITLDDKIFNNILSHKISNELIKAGEKHKLKFAKNIEFNTFINIENTVIMNLAYHFKKRVNDMFFISFKNTILQFRNLYLSYVNMGQSMNQFVEESEYNHIQFFSNIYYWSLRIISEVLKDEKKLIIHDVGTNTSIFPIFLKLIPENNLMNIDLHKIIASDIQAHWKIMNPRKLFKLSTNKINVKYEIIDILNNNTKCLGDVVTCFHVLEHLSDLEMVYSAIQKLWEKTSKLLIINLPIEEEISEIWGHYFKINQTNLRTWGKSLKGGKFLSDNYKFKNNKTLTDYGFLIVKKEN